MCKNKAEFTALVAKYRELTTEKKKIEASLDSVKADMEEYLKAKGTPKAEGSLTLVVFGDGYKVSLIPLENVSYDGKKLKAIFGEEAVKQCQNTKPYNRIDVR